MTIHYRPPVKGGHPIADAQYRADQAAALAQTALVAEKAAPAPVPVKPKRSVKKAKKVKK